MSIFDFDDFHETNNRYDLLWRLKEINPEFRCTLFAVPALGSTDFWDGVPDWCELAVHGWLHPDPYECCNWEYERMADLIDVIDDEYPWFVRGYKAPGWQISNGCYQALLDRDWWVADQHLEDARRPKGLRTYFYEDGEDRWHGHIQDWGSNGMNETWGELSARVGAATSFQFASEATG
jgi:hypothetical protein